MSHHWINPPLNLWSDLFHKININWWNSIYLEFILQTAIYINIIQRWKCYTRITWHTPEGPQYQGSGTTWRSCSGSSPPTSSRCCSPSRQSPPGQRRFPPGKCSSRIWARDQSKPGPDIELTREPSRAAWDLSRRSWRPRWGGWRRWALQWAWWCRTSLRAGPRRAGTSQTAANRTGSHLLHWADLNRVFIV